MQKVLSPLITTPFKCCFCPGVVKAQDERWMLIQSQDLNFIESELLGP